LLAGLRLLFDLRLLLRHIFADLRLLLWLVLLQMFAVLLQRLVELLLLGLILDELLLMGLSLAIWLPRLMWP